MAESSIYLTRLATIEEQLRSKADAATEQARGFLAARASSRVDNRSRFWHAAIKTMSIAIDLAEIERLQDSLLSLFRSSFCESLEHDQSFAAAVEVGETVQSLERLLQVSQARRTLVYHFWKTRLDSIRVKTEDIVSIAQDLHRAADWERAVRRVRRGTA